MVTKSQQIAEDLRREISEGRRSPGARMPSEPELSTNYGVSRTTARAAMAILAREGLVVAESGRGWLVREYAPLHWSLSGFERHRQTSAEHEGLDAWAAEVKRQGRQPAETVELAMVRPPERVAERLKVPGDELVVLRKRVRYVDDVPYQLADSYFPERIARGTPLMEPKSVSALGGVLAASGHRQSRYRDEIVVRMPTRDESLRLDLPTGTPVAEVTRTGYAEDGSPLRVMVSVAPGDRNILVYDLDAE
jgi:DNA-binding GntR family transcriptional regulator